MIGRLSRIGAIKRRKGKMDGIDGKSPEGASLIQKDSWPLQNLTFNYALQRNFGRRREKH